jgi:hypothetical protein
MLSLTLDSRLRAGRSSAWLIEVMASSFAGGKLRALSRFLLAGEIGAQPSFWSFLAALCVLLSTTIFRRRRFVQSSN